MYNHSFSSYNISFWFFTGPIYIYSFPQSIYFVYFFFWQMRFHSDSPYISFFSFCGGLPVLHLLTNMIHESLVPHKFFLVSSPLKIWNSLSCLLQKVLFQGTSFQPFVYVTMVYGVSSSPLHHFLFFRFLSLIYFTFSLGLLSIYRFLLSCFLEMLQHMLLSKHIVMPQFSFYLHLENYYWLGPTVFPAMNSHLLIPVIA